MTNIRQAKRSLRVFGLHKFVLSCLLAFFSSHLCKAATYRSGESVVILKEDKLVRAQVKPGFHFNLKATNLLFSGNASKKPTQTSERELVFALDANETEGKVRVFVCDDAVTFCEVREFPFQAEIAKNTEQKTAQEIVGSSANQDLKTEEHGFILNDLAEGLKQAKANGQLVLVDFTARWCPPCIRLDQEVFSQAEFKKLSQNFVKVRIDVDQFSNSVLSEKFKVQGIPTVLVINSEQKEISRTLDFKPLAKWKSFLDSVKADPLPLDELIVKAKKKNPDVIKRLGLRLLLAGRAKEALDQFKLLNPPPAEIWTARIEAAEDNKAKEKVIRQALEIEPESSRSLEWRLELLKVVKDPEEKYEIRGDGISVADLLLRSENALKESLRHDEVGEFLGYEAFLIALRRTELIEKGGGKPKDIAAAYKKAADVARALNIPIENKGLKIRFLSLLIKAGRSTEAEKTLTELLKAYPDDVEILRRKMAFYVEVKKFKSALEIGDKILPLSYGANELYVAEAYAKALIGEKKKKQAREFLDRYLTSSQYDWTQLSAAKANLEKLRKKT